MRKINIFKFENDKLSKPIEIYYSFHQTIFGTCLLAIYDKKIIALDFCFEKNEDFYLKQLKKLWRQAIFLHDEKKTQYFFECIFNNSNLDICVKATDFQIKVWEELLKIPSGQTLNYQQIAENIGNKNATRAVGAAIGKNPIAWLIPCHRILPKNKKIGNFRWGSGLKIKMLQNESLNL